MILDAIKKVSFFHVYTENHTKEEYDMARTLGGAQW
jgi:hypothetical protein